MIYVIQKNTLDANVIYAGSSAHEALIAASNLENCKIRLFKGGKRFVVTTTKDSGNE